MDVARKNPAIVIDNGSGFTKVGYAGAAEPHCTFQTVIGKKPQHSKENPLDDLAFQIGKAISPYEGHFPIKHGVVEDWDTMEQLWQMCFFDKLRCNPEDHCVLLTEPPLYSQQKREQVAEIMFEEFNVPGLNFSAQAVLSLAASWTNDKVIDRTMTGAIVHSGYGTTQIVPVVDGHVIRSCIEQINIGGRDITAYIQQLMRERKEPIPSGMNLEVARAVKERYTYTCPNIKKECDKFDSNPEKYIRLYEGLHRKTGKNWSCNIECERFLAPEAVANPQIVNSAFNTTLADMVDSVIQNCPIDSRKALYSNIVLSGGNTCFKNFGRRLQRDLKNKVDCRLSATRAELGAPESTFNELSVNVVENHAQASQVWLGGSIVASKENFHEILITRAQYEEEGARMFRQKVAIP